MARTERKTVSVVARSCYAQDAGGKSIKKKRRVIQLTVQKAGKPHGTEVEGEQSSLVSCLIRP